MLSSLLRRVRRDRSGQALVEFTLAVPVLMLLFVGIFEFSRHYYTRLTIRHAVTEAARFAATGQQLTDPDSGETMTRAESIVAVMQRGTAGLALDVDRIVIDPPDGGGPDEVVRIQATYRFEFLGAAIIRQFAPPFVEFTVATTIKNEPVF